MLGADLSNCRFGFSARIHRGFSRKAFNRSLCSSFTRPIGRDSGCIATILIDARDCDSGRQRHSHGPPSSPFFDAGFVSEKSPESSVVPTFP